MGGGWSTSALVAPAGFPLRTREQSRRGEGLGFRGSRNDNDDGPVKRSVYLPPGRWASRPPYLTVLVCFREGSGAYPAVELGRMSRRGVWDDGDGWIWRLETEPSWATTDSAFPRTRPPPASQPACACGLGMGLGGPGLGTKGDLPPAKGPMGALKVGAEHTTALHPPPRRPRSTPLEAFCHHRTGQPNVKCRRGSATDVPRT